MAAKRTVWRFSVSFELNGSLKIETITRVNSLVSAIPTPKTKTVAPTAANQVTFVQDQVGVSDLGPSVKIDLGDIILKGDMP